MAKNVTLKSTGIFENEGRVRYGSVRFGTVRYGLVRFDTVRYGSVRFGTVQFGKVRFGDASEINSIEILYYYHAAEI